MTNNDEPTAVEGEATGVTSSEDVRTALVRFLEGVTQFGLFPIVAYGLEGDSVLLLTCTIPKLPDAMEVLRDATHRDYNLRRHLSGDQARRIANSNPYVVRLQEQQISGLQTVDREFVGGLVGCFGAPFYRQKAFALVDICGFSRLSHAEQLSQLYGLTNVLKSSMRRVKALCTQLRISARFGHTSTGDGYYMWHDYIGGNADVAVFALLLCVMVQAEAMRRNGFPMRLKGAYIIDSAFMLFDADASASSDFKASNAVGAATNGAARLIACCLPSQILVGDFRRSGQGEETMTPASLLAQVNELFRVEGRGAANLSFEPSQLTRVADKHGTHWYCWNLVGQIPNSATETTRQRIGLMPDKAVELSSVRFRSEP